MTPEEFTKEIERRAQEIRTYVNTKFPVQAGDTALRFINGNFRAQGWQGASFQQWKPNKRKGTILVKSGHLRSASYYTIQPAQVTIKNTLPYAKIHNEGGVINKTATVRAHTRRGRRKETYVKSHTRRMNLTVPKRQFAPSASSPSPVLNNAIVRRIDSEIKRIFKIN